MKYISTLINNLDIKADVLILAGGEHLYWYHNLEYELQNNELYKNEKQKYMLTRDMSDKYDRDALKTSLNRIVERVTLFSFLFHYNFNISEALKIWYIKIKKALSVT